ncbi:MAG: hypothetical protein LBO69_00090 [Ignavibacteria bacterium]|jgi:hypothetical protein|nr:hypothetical protein [Ignavibacteria bacterium]
MEKVKYILIALLVLAVLLSLYMLKPPKAHQTEREVDIEVVIDTGYIHIKRPAVEFRSQGRIMYTKLVDSVEQPEFVSQFDTVVYTDTIHLEYAYPLNLWTLQMHSAMDSVQYTQVVIRQQKEKWWVKPTIVVGGVLVGILVGWAVK